MGRSSVLSNDYSSALRSLLRDELEDTHDDGVPLKEQRPFATDRINAMADA